MAFLKNTFRLIPVSPCHRRGVLMEIPAIALFGYSCLLMSGVFEPFVHTTDYMNALYQSPDPKWVETASVWWFFRSGIVAIVVILFLRLYSSFSIFDHDQKECTDWIHPLTGTGRFLETVVRLAVVAYLIFQIQHGITGQVRPLVIDTTRWFGQISSYENLQSIISYHLKGPSLESSSLRGEQGLIDGTANEMRSLSLNIAVLVELMIISLFWDLFLLTGRVRIWKAVVGLAHFLKSKFTSTASASTPAPEDKMPNTMRGGAAATSAIPLDQNGEGRRVNNLGASARVSYFSEICEFPFKVWLKRFVVPHLFVALFMIFILFIISFLTAGDDTPLKVALLVIAICIIVQILLSASIILSWIIFVLRKLFGYVHVRCAGFLGQ